MEEPITTPPQSLENPPPPVPTAPPAEATAPKPKLPPAVIAAIVVIGLGAFFVLLLGNLQTGRRPVAPTPTPTLIPTPTPERIPSALATQSAFLKSETAVASLSSSVKNYVIDDPSLSPPILDLPLGFQ